MEDTKNIPTDEELKSKVTDIIDQAGEEVETDSKLKELGEAVMERKAQQKKLEEERAKAQKKYDDRLKFLKSQRTGMGEHSKDAIAERIMSIPAEKH